MESMKILKQHLNAILLDPRFKETLFLDTPARINAVSR